MAESEEQKAAEAPPAEAPKKKSKKGLVLGGGMVGLIALAYVASLMAVPKKEVVHELGKPFVVDLHAEDISVNLSGNNNRNYLLLKMRGECISYDQHHSEARIAEPLCQTMLLDKTLTVLSSKTKVEIDTTSGKEALREELRLLLDPILFPVVIGAADGHAGEEEPSGLRTGTSASRGTMRGLFYDHVIHVDGPDKTIALDEGDKVSFHGDEEDLRLLDANGDSVFLDVTSLKPEFEGEVHVGVLGRIRGIYFSKLISQ